MRKIVKQKYPYVDFSEDEMDHWIILANKILSQLTIFQSYFAEPIDFYNLMPPIMSEDQDSWIIFGPNVGPRRLGRWVIYCEPDIILCIKGRLFVIEVKCSSIGQCIAPILEQAPVLCEPMIPLLRPTSYA